MRPQKYPGTPLPVSTAEPWDRGMRRSLCPGLSVLHRHPRITAPGHMALWAGLGSRDAADRPAGMLHCSD